MMSRRTTGLVAAAIVGVSLAAAAHAVDMLQDLRKKLEQAGQAAVDAIQTPPGPGWDAGREAARALLSFTVEEEVAIGRQAAGNLLGVAPLVDNARLQIYVNRVGRWIASRSARPELPWRFGVIESNDINAFAAPGGYVLVTKGLYRVLRNESELAGVLAHEIAHIVEKHHLKLLGQQRLLDRAGQVLTDAVGHNEHVGKLIGSGAEIFARRLDKDAEHDADRLAMVLAARAGYDPFGLPMVLQDLARAASHDSRVALLFRTHPHPDERLAKLEDVGERLDGVRGNVNGKRFYRLRR